jgi:hypothetical protein
VVLEFKRPYTVFPDEWHAAIVNSPETATEVVMASYEKEVDETAATLLEKNAIMLSKQVSKYRDSTRCIHIILFDWRNMIGLDFETDAEEDEGWNEITAPIGWWAVTEHFAHETEKCPLENGKTFRQALVGVIVDSVGRAAAATAH